MGGEEGLGLPATPFVLSRPQAVSKDERHSGEGRNPVKTNTVGGSPTASHFSCLAKKSNPKKSPPVRRPFGVPCVARLVRPPHKLARPAARSRAQTYASESPRLSCATRRRTGARKSKAKSKHGGHCPPCHTCGAIWIAPTHPGYRKNDEAQNTNATGAQYSIGNHMNVYFFPFLGMRLFKNEPIAQTANPAPIPPRSFGHAVAV